MMARFSAYALADGLATRNLMGRPPEVLTALVSATKAVDGVSVALGTYANTRGIGGKATLADKQLSVLGSNDAQRLLLRNPDVRAYLLARALIDKTADSSDVSSLAAAAAGLFTIVESTGLQQALGLSKEPDNPWERLFETLVDEVVRTNNLSTIVGQNNIRDDIVDELRQDPPSLVGTAVTTRVEQIISLAKSPAKKALRTWIGKAEIRPELLSQPGLEEGMLNYLAQLGVEFGTGRATQKFDEYFALAYEHVSRQFTMADDPIQAKFTGTITDWDFSVDSLDGIEQQQAINKNIRAAGALDYVFVLGERLGIYKLCDALVLRWAHGALDIPDGAAADKLYRYWKLRDERSAPEERGLLYRRILAKGSTKVLRGMVVNEDFPVLWGQFMEQIVDFIEKSESTRSDDRGPSKVRLTRTTKQLQYNLTEHMTGMAQVQTAEIYAQLRDALEILADPQIVSIIAGGRRQNLWTVIERLNREEFANAINVEALRSVAVDGNRVFQWLADYVPGREDTPAFEDFLDAAESYIVAEASVQADNADFLDNDELEEEDGDEFDEFDELEDEFDEFADEAI
jgi:hypothetical protein